MSEVKNTVNEINGRLDITKENINEVESMAVETIESETIEKRILFSPSPQQKEHTKWKYAPGERKSLRKLMVENFPNSMKAIEESPWTSSTRNMKRTIARHIVVQNQ